MKRIALLIASLTLLAACSGNSTTLESQLKNPLYAARYGDILADTLANMIIMNDPSVQDQKAKANLEQEIEKAKIISDDARREIDKGTMGAFMQDKESVSGYALYLDDTLFFSSDFETKPGVELHVYISTVVDPRDHAFPDASAIDLGPLQSAYGAQAYAVPRLKSQKEYRSVALWDRSLKRMYAFTQLSKKL